MRRIRLALIPQIMLLLMLAYFGRTAMIRAEEAGTRWEKLLSKYQEKKNTDRLIFVQYMGRSKCRVLMYKKIRSDEGGHEWELILDCKGYAGQNGINKKREGDRRTPTGTFWITSGFGILDDPGVKIPYVKLNSYLYWSGEAGTYNTMVDSRQLGHVPANSEHLIPYDPYYNYALTMSYNPKNIVGKGSAIFVHCTGSKSYTGGCVAIKQKKMKKMMRNVTAKTRICIYKM